MSKFQNKVSAKPEGFVGGDLVQLPAGDHIVTIDRLYFTDDTYSGLLNPVKKDNLPEWKDVTDQLAIVMHNEKGVIAHRLNACGFKRLSEIPEDQQTGLISLGLEGYAVEEATMTRIEDPARTAKCDNIFNQVMNCAGLPEGSKAEELAGRQIGITVENKTFGENTRPVVTKWRVVGENAVVDIQATMEATNADPAI